MIVQFLKRFLAGVQPENSEGQVLNELVDKLNEVVGEVNGISGLGQAKVITTSAYDLLSTDDQPSMLVLNGGTSVTAITINAGIVKADFTQLIVDMVGGGSVAVGSGVTLLAPNGSATTSAGDEITIACPFDDVVVLGGSTS